MSGRENDTEDYIKCKVVLIGKSGVGKTSIITRYTTDTFKLSQMSTPGANFTVKKVEFPEEKQNIKFEIWDTAGQEKYKALAKVFYNNASSCILVYDVTSRPSFEDIKNYWVEELRTNAPKNTSMQLILIIIILYDFSTRFGW